MISFYTRDGHPFSSVTFNNCVEEGVSAGAACPLWDRLCSDQVQRVAGNPQPMSSASTDEQICSCQTCRWWSLCQQNASKEKYKGKHCLVIVFCCKFLGHFGSGLLNLHSFWKISFFSVVSNFLLFSYFVCVVTRCEWWQLLSDAFLPFYFPLCAEHWSEAFWGKNDSPQWQPPFLTRKQHNCQNVSGELHGGTRQLPRGVWLLAGKVSPSEWAVNES